MLPKRRDTLWPYNETCEANYNAGELSFRIYREVKILSQVARYYI